MSTRAIDSSPSAIPPTQTNHHVCPWWVGYLLLFPLRRLAESPERLLGPLVAQGMHVLDFGASMGYFSLPAARLVGPTGRVVSVDLADKALSVLRRRARRARLGDRIDVVRSNGAFDWCDGRRESFDLALTMYVVHELPDAKAGLAHVVACLKPGGKLLIAEPKGHVTKEAFAAELQHLADLGMTPLPAPTVRRGHIALLAKSDPR